MLTLLTVTQRKVLSCCLVFALISSIFVSGANNVAQAESSAGPNLLPYKVLEEFEGDGFVGAVNPIKAKSQFAHVSRPEPVVFGKQSARLSYQFTNSESGTSAAYLDFFNDSTMKSPLKLEGKPTKFGVWVYGDGNKHWLRAHFNNRANYAADLTQNNKLDWVGWRYVVFSLPSEYLKSDYPELVLNRIYVTQLSDSSKTDGILYFDRLTAFYEDTDGLYGLDLAGLTPMKVGESKTALALETREGYSAPMPATEGVTFTSSNPNVAIIDSDGVVSALSDGTTIVTASKGVFESTYELVVSNEDAVVSQLTLMGPNQVEVKDVFSTELFATFEGSTTPLKIFEGAEYNSSDNDVATVDSNGVVTTHNIGTTTITADYKGERVTHSLEVIARIQRLESIQITDLSPVDIGASKKAKVLAKYNIFDELQEISEGVVFKSSKPGIATVDNNGVITGISVGATIITAQLEGKSAMYKMVVNKPGLIAPKRELRAAWIATVEKIDWPKSTVLEQQKQEYIDILNMHQDIGMNAVIMQVKPTADAFYKSDLAPWSHWLTGTQGKDPGYDPLAFMIEETHKRNMEFHAWFNPYRISMNTDRSQLVADHPAIENPDWVIEYGGKLYFDPGVPEVIDYITNSVMEVVKKYDIDAVHFDDYFYPNRFDGENNPDQATYEKYGKSKYSDINEWRRNNVDTLIQGLSEKIKAEKSYVKFGISPFGVWRNKSVDPSGSDTAAGQPSYDNLHADIRKWVDEGWIDYVTPQIYWNFTYSPAAYEVLVKWWSDLMRDNKSKKTQLYIGHADYKADDVNYPDFSDPYEIPNQLKFNWNYPEVKGSMHFTTRDFKNKPELTQKIKDVYRYPSLVPTMPWLEEDAPAKIASSSISTVQQGSKVKLSWKDADDKTTYFVVYRTVGDQPINMENPAQIASIIRKNAEQMSYIDEQTVVGETYNYAITAVNRLHYESLLSDSKSIKVQSVPSGGDGGGVIIAPPSSSSTIAAGSAGSVSLESNVTVDVPAGAMDEAFILTITKLLNTANLNNGNHNIISSIYEITKNVTGNFKKTVQIKMAYDPAKLADNERPALFYYDEDKREWVYIGGIAQDGFVMATVDHFTKFAVIAVEKGTVDPGCEAAVFTDIDMHWAKEQINAAVAKCIVNGYSDKTFRPEKSITREEFAVMLVRASGLSGEAGSLNFSDSAKISSWAQTEVAYAVQAGIITGYSDGTFRPKAEINRAEVTAMVVRALQLEHKAAASTSFADDASIPAWAKEYVNAAVDKKIIEGRSGNRFAPLAQTTRAEAAVIMLRLLDQLK